MNTSPGTLERAALVQTLDGARGQILSIMTGLSEQQQRTAALPSGWTPIGLIRHLTVSDEHYWFESIVGGQPLNFPEGRGADWLVEPTTPVISVLDAYRSQIDISNSWIADTDIDAPPRRSDPAWQEWNMDFPTLRSVLHHVILETATHLGHLDAAVELMDGRQRIAMG